MSISFNRASAIVTPGQTVAVCQAVAVSASNNPAFLVVNALDRNEYTVGSSGATGSFAGNGHTLALGSIGSDMRGAGIVFTFVAATGRYVNGTFGDLSALTFNASSSGGDVTDVSLFGTASASLANSYAANAIALAQRDAACYAGTLTLAPGAAGPAPAQATPLSVAAVARGFVGSAWNKDGCWVLASTIAAEAGASLPVQSAVDMAGAANGEWFVAFNGPAGSSGDWASDVRTGDVVGLVTSGGTGHITTCVSGAGSTATLIDNVTYVNGHGDVVNGANDGSAADILIAPAHSAASTWAGVAASSVVIFRLDTPAVTPAAATVSLPSGGTTALAAACSISDPAGRPITAVQAYTGDAADLLMVGGVSRAATSAAGAVTAASLGQIALSVGASVTADTVTVRAFNGLYWGDWASVDLRATAGGVAAPQASPVASSLASTPSPDPVAVFRFFDTADGTHFFTASAAEAATLSATRTDLVAEGVGMKGWATATPGSEAVFRFFDAADGTHFYTASSAERDTLLATRSADMTFEGTAFYEDASPQAADTAVFRFFDTVHGTHLFTQSAGERASIAATRPDLVAEGIAFYAPA